MIWIKGDRKEKIKKEESEEVSIKVAKIKNYLKETYQKLGEVFYSYYWNWGYINCLNDEGKIDEVELAKLASYNNILYFEESKKIGERLKESMKIPIKEGELKEMKTELERIKKRIDESIRKCSTVVLTSSDICISDIIEKIEEGRKALQIYKELIEEYEKINNPVYDIGITIKKLEDKYYPQPKTFKQRLTDIINEHLDLARIQSYDGLKKALIKLRDDS